MLSKHKQKGFTIIELWFVLVALICIGVLGTVAFVGFHFLSKWW
jgi:type II secretory pathway pseudopilin PulG